ncbi:hypothetical protein [Streptomyces sp. NPDC046805]|uniref:hypothetical protein n=1 Tax=Streptomyces sp. NPDC046805 TaxID=3155134 RepID=UPI0033EDEC07
MLTHKSLVRAARAFCVGALATLASTAPAVPASAATLQVACNEAALRSAIDTANGTAARDTLNLSGGCVYRLTGALPDITSPIVINGSVATITRQTGASAFRILTVNGGDLTLRTTFVTGGDVRGGSGLAGAGGGIVVYDNGSLKLNTSVVTGNRAEFGGGISVFSGSTADVNASTFTGNHATQNGGGIVNDGTVSVDATRFSTNSADGAGGAIASVGSLTVNASSLTNNQAATGAGLANGVPNAGGGTSSVSASTISNNTAQGTNPGGIVNIGGSVTLRSTRAADNTPNNCLTGPSSVPGCAE